MRGASGLPDQTRLVQHLADELLQDLQLSENTAQVTSKSGPDRLCSVVSATFTSEQLQVQCLQVAIKANNFANSQ